MPLALLLALQAAPAALEQIPFDLASVRAEPAQPQRASHQCAPPSGKDEIVVCGSRPDRFRLPLREEPVAGLGLGYVSGEAMAPAGVLVPSGGCGIFAGEHPCSHAEAAQYGYGQGRDPLSLLVRLGTKLTNSDAELGPPSPVAPER